MRRAAAAVVALALSVLWAARADAHDPIILTADQTTPSAGPGLPDGTISFALYGTLAGGTDTRGFRARLRSGQRLELTLLLPDLAPERDLAESVLPFLTVVAPDGATTEHRADQRVAFAEEFSGTNYVRLLDVDEAVTTTGEYGITVAGPTTARFTVAIGSVERFGTPVDGVPNRAEGVAGVQRWYATPPLVATASATTAPAPTTTGATTSAAPPTTGATTTTTTTATSSTSGATTTTAPTAAAPAANRTKGTIVLITVMVLAGGGRLLLRKRRLRRTRP